MAKLNTIKNRHHLQEADALMPVFRKLTCWSSTFAMIDRYLAIYAKLDRVDDELADFIPTPRENVNIKELYEDLKNLESGSKKLQTSSVFLLDVRMLFDHVMMHYPTTKSQLAVTVTLVKFPDFENGIVKLLAGKWRSLTRGDRLSVAKLPQSDGATALDEPEPPVTKKRSFAEAVMADESAAPGQVDLRRVPPFSNDVEQMFSRADIIYSRPRRSLNLITLETVLFLQYNPKLWDASAVAPAVKNNRKKPAVKFFFAVERAGYICVKYEYSH
ncbi:hypothetical protein PF011_g22819 [Phytophthora fragariae]|uniref:HAT C-terminal dimerisation domain-containing protein n=1 Tax=Phytophthora fragariae TaxID=53985 RepID=A0A6A3IDH6_9STRA|nr:hypothetical protein PF011_g22819 [Phytophthora fragariae]